MNSGNALVNHINKKAGSITIRLLLRREGSNLRPSGYEPDELPLLYFAILRCEGNALGY